MMITLRNALLCVNCDTICDAGAVRGERCPSCDAQGSLLSLSRVLNPDAATGRIKSISLSYAE